MKKCPFLTKEKYMIEYQDYKIGSKEIKKTVFMDCIGTECAAYNPVSGKCSKTGQITRDSGSLLGSGYTVKSMNPAIKESR